MKPIAKKSLKASLWILSVLTFLLLFLSYIFPPTAGIAARSTYTKSISNAKILGLSIRIYHHETGQYPDRLRQVEPLNNANSNSNESFILEDYLCYQEDETWQSWLYFKPGTSNPPDTQILLASPAPHKTKNGICRIILQVDGAAMRMPESEYQTLIKQQKQ